MKPTSGVWPGIVLAVLFLLAPGASDAASPCAGKLPAIKKDLKTTADAGGIWGLIDTYPGLDKISSTAIQLDSKAQKLISLAGYLCETRDGVPLDELATFVEKQIRKMGEQAFRDEQIILGKTRTEIDTWLAYRLKALEFQKRTLDSEKIGQSLKITSAFVSRYRALAAHMQKKEPAERVSKEAQTLLKDLEDGLKNDEYLALAVQETGAVPFWDVDENYGGS